MRGWVTCLQQKPMKNTIMIPMDEVVARERASFFDRNNMQTRLPQTAHVDARGRAWFVTSEKFEDAPRLYTIRFLHPDTNRVETYGEFQGYASRPEALRVIQHIVANVDSLRIPYGEEEDTNQ